MTHLFFIELKMTIVRLESNLPNAWPLMATCVMFVRVSCLRKFWSASLCWFPVHGLRLPWAEPGGCTLASVLDSDCLYGEPVDVFLNQGKNNHRISMRNEGDILWNNGGFHPILSWGEPWWFIKRGGFIGVPKCLVGYNLNREVFQQDRKRNLDLGDQNHSKIAINNVII